MARLNVPGSSSHLEKTHEGAIARRITPKQQLERSVMANLLWEDEFYEDGVKIGKRIEDLCNIVPLSDLSEIAIKARHEMYLRHVPLLIIKGMIKNGSGNKIVADTIEKVISRPDELTELLAIYWKDGKTPLSAQLKKGLARAFLKFNAYSLAKYNRNDAIKLRDVMFLTKPKPKTPEQEETFKKLAEGTLESPDTWEVSLSAGKDKKETFTRLIQENKLGGLALLRNLRNMIESKVSDDVIRKGILSNEFKYVLPFRFISASKYAPQFEPELEERMFKSLSEMPKLKGKTALVVDHSGSMRERLSSKSDVTRFDTAAGLAMLIREIAEDVRIYAFSAKGSFSNWQIQTYGRALNLSETAFAKIPPRRGFALKDSLEKATCWGGTDVEGGKKMADEDGYDRIIIITDEQSETTLSNPSGKLGYVINIASNKNGIGYGRNWNHIDGWSENVVRYIQELESLEIEG